MQGFKKHTLDRITTLEKELEMIKSQENPQNGPIHYERFFIRSLEDRILSLERQLSQKQAIIDKLLTTPLEVKPCHACEVQDLGGRIDLNS